MSKLPPKIKHFAPIGVQSGQCLRELADHPCGWNAGTAVRSRKLQTDDAPGPPRPHVWIREGKSTLDLFGRGFTMLRFDQAVDVSRACHGGTSGRRSVGGSRYR